MKKTIPCLIFIIALGLNSCSSSLGFASDSNKEQHDVLLYQIIESSDQRKLALYDPANNLHTQILPDWEIYGFSLNTNNRLAFSSLYNGKSKIYVLDYPFIENNPIEITPDMSTEYAPLSWSPDGHYLLLDSFQAGNNKLSIWDGKRISDIHNYHQKVSEIAWSPSGQLAFTDFYTFISPHDGDSSEIYVWDGKATISLSQNPSGVDRFPAWSKDGQLAFLSERDGEYDVFVWDGVSKDNGVPDVKTFVNIAPELTQYFSNPTWTNTESIAFSAGSESDVHVQVYEWNGRSAKNISQNPSFHNGGQTWRNDGYWSFTTFFSSDQYLYIRDNLNQTVLETKGQYRPAWSPNGLLVFCIPEPPGWTLAMWNGKNVVEIAHGNSVVAKWNNEEYVFCSSG